MRHAGDRSGKVHCPKAGSASLQLRSRRLQLADRMDVLPDANSRLPVTHDCLGVSKCRRRNARKPREAKDD